ncbi:MAG: proline dehydrogenase family protein [Gemmatimonadales bacterium]
MSLARGLLLRASRSNWLAGQLRRRGFVRRAVRRFLPGEDVADALAAAADYAGRGIGSVLTQLGEQVRSEPEADAVRDHYLGVLDLMRQRSLRGQVSVKLTHLGLEVDREACLARVHALAARADATGSFLWIDMEESRYTDATLELFRQVRGRSANVGVCLQAYLRRTPADLAALLPLGPAIRLVKGAYNEPPHVALPRKADVDASYLALTERLLGAARNGARAVCGTPDLRLIERIRARAAALKLAPEACEFHMLYGIRTAQQQALAAAGAKVRVLISYGSAWFAWYMRRLAERPANVWFVVRSLF